MPNFHGITFGNLHSLCILTLNRAIIVAGVGLYVSRCELPDLILVIPTLTISSLSISLI